MTPVFQSRLGRARRWISQWASSWLADGLSRLAVQFPRDSRASKFFGDACCAIFDHEFEAGRRHAAGGQP